MRRARREVTDGAEDEAAEEEQAEAGEAAAVLAVCWEASFSHH